MRHTSIGARPERIHSAITRPTPPAPAMPCAQNPAATKKPPMSDAPRMNSPSGVKASGPLIILTTPADCIAGITPKQPSASGSNRGQSAGSSSLLKPADGPCSSQAHGAAPGLRSEVHEAVGVTKCGKVRMDTVDGLRQQVLVGEGNDRHFHACH